MAPSCAFVPLGDVNFDNTRCRKKQRPVTRDKCVSYRARALQLEGHGPATT